MSFLKFIIFFIIIFVSSCSDRVQNNGLTITKIQQMDIKVNITTKKELVEKYGPPVFESVFNNGIIYYVSHRSSYLNFNPRTTKELIVLEIKLDKKNIVKNIKKYTENDARDINVSEQTTNIENNSVLLWKQILDNLKKNNLRN